MPKSYLKSQTPPYNPVDDWLLWSASQLESFIGDPSNKIAGILGINKAGDLQYIIMPTIVPEALGVALVVLGNSTDASSKLAFVYLDMYNLGYTSLIETPALIPREICPEEQLPTPDKIPQEHYLGNHKGASGTCVGSNRSASLLWYALC